MKRTKFEIMLPKIEEMEQASVETGRRTDILEGCGIF
jgi:hypothetical protein